MRYAGNFKEKTLSETCSKLHFKSRQQYWLDLNLRWWSQVDRDADKLRWMDQYCSFERQSTSPQNEERRHSTRTAGGSLEMQSRCLGINYFICRLNIIVFQHSVETAVCSICYILEFDFSLIFILQLCEILPNQVVMKKLDKNQTRIMIREAAKPPAERKRRIMAAVSWICLSVKWFYG